MRLFGGALILGGILSALAAAPATAAPILSSSADTGTACDSVLGVANSNCSLFSLGTFTGTETFDLDLAFASDRDVALFEFSIDTDATFAAQAQTSAEDVLFPLLGLFTGDQTKTVYTYSDPVNGELQALAFERLDGVLLDGVQDNGSNTSYYFAVTLFPNEFTGLPTSLLSPFACDGENRDGLDPEGNVLCPGAGGNFTLQFSATFPDGGPAPVPEPGTLALLGSGLVAAAVRRRQKKRI